MLHTCYIVKIGWTHDRCTIGAPHEAEYTTLAEWREENPGYRRIAGGSLPAPLVNRHGWQLCGYLIGSRPDDLFAVCTDYASPTGREVCEICDDPPEDGELHEVRDNGSLKTWQACSDCRPKAERMAAALRQLDGMQ